MGQCLSEQFENVLIVDGVIDEPARASRAHEPHAPQQPQLVRRGGLADTDERGDVADAELAAGQRIEDPDAGGITEDAERVSQRFDRARSHQCGFSRFGEMRPLTLDGCSREVFFNS